jgi:capsular exopolysaccharide synthesis family protein
MSAGVSGRYHSLVPEPKPEQHLGLLDYWRIVWARRITVVIVIAIALVLALGIDLTRTKVYTGTSSLLFVSQNFVAGGGTVELTPQDVATQIRLVTSSTVEANAALALKKVPPAPTVTQVGSTTVADIAVASPDAPFAAQAANAYAQAYIDATRSRFIKQETAAETGIQQQIDAQATQITDIQTSIARATAAQAVPLTAQLGSLEARQQALQTQLSQIQINVAQAPSGGQIVSYAKVPVAPTSPKPVTDVLLAGLLGLVIGVALVLIQDFLDDRIRTQSDLEAAISDRPTLGLIPKLSSWKNSKTPVLLMLSQPRSPIAEAYRGLRTSLAFAGLENPVRVIEITSAGAGEGKTTTSANLAASIAESGRSVCLVDCDLRRPRVHEFFGVANSVGLTDVLTGNTALDDACIPSNAVDGLWILPSGPLPPNPSELLDRNRTRGTFASLASKFDMVILDTSPVLPVTDAAVLSGAVDAVIIVATANKSTFTEMAKTIQILERVDAPILGVVLNAASEADASVYYRYGEDGETSVPAANTTRRDRRQSAQRRTRRNSGEN